MKWKKTTLHNKKILTPKYCKFIFIILFTAQVLPAQWLFAKCPQGFLQTIQDNSKLLTLFLWEETYNSFQADFKQISYLASFDLTAESYGHLYYKRPKHIRLDYTKPKKELFLVNQEKSVYWQYTLNQAIVTTLNFGEERYPALFLGSLKKLVKNSSIINICIKKDKSNYYLEAKPLKQNNLFLKYSINYKTESGEPKIITIWDNDNNTNSLVLSNFNYKNKIDDNIFNIKIPYGVDIIKNKI